MREREARAIWMPRMDAVGVLRRQKNRHMCTVVNLDVACSWFGGKVWGGSFPVVSGKIRCSNSGFEFPPLV